ncbi:4422_t:CDS:1 [Paraglomus occultum]|uniref:4422_t:CDS:1 n=1 Tax=Paraglomus occultum TaxID=144539 RepID=A0A9N9G7D4_9GLOM|nr:4422_t:CDS:1 [Paraglomus occultum]
MQYLYTYTLFFLTAFIFLTDIPSAYSLPSNAADVVLAVDVDVEVDISYFYMPDLEIEPSLTNELLGIVESVKFSAEKSIENDVLKESVRILALHDRAYEGIKRVVLLTERIAEKRKDELIDYILYASRKLLREYKAPSFEDNEENEQDGAQADNDSWEEE